MEHREPMSEPVSSVPAALPPDEARRLEELHSYEVLDTLSEQAYDDITLLASEICDCPIALVSLVDEGRQWFKSRVGLEATETPRDEAFCAHAILEPGELLVVRDATEDVRFAANPLVISEPSIRFYAGAPLRTSRGDALGTLCVIDRVARDLSDQQLRALEALSRQVMAQLELRRSLIELGRYVERRKQYEQHLDRYQQELEEANARLSELSNTDSLTGLHNRRALMEKLERECKRARRTSSPLALALLDVDHFKGYNDAYGHPSGDQALVQLADVLREIKRASDFVARLGGEEFAIVLVDTGFEGGVFAAERIRKTVETAQWARRPLTVSLGVAVFEADMPDVEALLAAADRALYQAKRAGRNRVCAVEGEPDPELQDD